MSGEFTTQWAIRLPSGELLTYQPPCTHAAHIFGACPPPRRVVVFDDKSEAEVHLDALSKQAAALGVTSWMGRIEQRTCSPFSVTDPGAGFVDEVTKWAEQQGGES